MTPVFPVAYFGPVAYYRKMTAAGEAALEVMEHYVKQTLRNRATILGPNGVQNLSVPVVKPSGNKTATKDVLVSGKQDWRKDHWKAIETAYAPAPYFDHYGMEVHELIYAKEENLIRFNLDIHQRIVSWLDLPVKITPTIAYERFPQGADLRESFKEGTLTDEVAYMQVFPPGGQFMPGLSILDAIFNLGPMARKLLTGP